MENQKPKVNMEKIITNEMMTKKTIGRPKKTDDDIEVLIEIPKIIYKKTKEQNLVYNKAYIERNKDRTYHCEVCDLTMTYFSSHNHPKTKRHMLNQFLKEKKQQQTQPAYLKPPQGGCME
jgi:hypothetical protein